MSVDVFCSRHSLPAFTHSVTIDTVRHWGLSPVVWANTRIALAFRDALLKEHIGRDPKGHYVKAPSGVLKDFLGIDSFDMSPEISNFLVVTSGSML